MKNIMISIAVFSFCVLASAQSENNEIRTEQHTVKLEDYMREVSYKIGVGVLMPKDGIKEYFDVSPMLDLSLNFPLKNKKYIDFTLQFVIPNQVDTFTYARPIDTIQAKGTLMVNAFLKFKKDIIQTNTSRFNIGLGIGISNVTTDARNPFYRGNEEEEKYENFTALLVSPGIELAKIFKRNDEITIGLSFQYSPYKIEGALQENIGALFLVPKIAYRF